MKNSNAGWDRFEDVTRNFAEIFIDFRKDFSEVMCLFFTLIAIEVARSKSVKVGRPFPWGREENTSMPRTLLETLRHGNLKCWIVNRTAPKNHHSR